MAIYKNYYVALGVCIVRCRVRGRRGSEVPQIFEVETMYGLSRIVSTYRYQCSRVAGYVHDESSELDLCRYAIAQFLRRNKYVHIATVEILDTSCVPYPGKLTPVRITAAEDRYLYNSRTSLTDSLSQ
jgi:hypothetical protein